MICAGIDAGSRTIKVVLVDGETFETRAQAIADQGIEQNALAQRLFDEALAGAGIARSDISHVVATGYGRNVVDFADTTITEITCHARGVRQLVPDARTIVDIGGQDSKLIRLDNAGFVRDFAMNDRCAAGTGRFLEIVADRLGIELSSLGDLAASSAAPAMISNMCAVFAETEIVGLLASGAAPRDIAAGVQASLASRVAAMAGRRVEAPVVFTGGVALLTGMVEALSSALGCRASVSPRPQMTGALGAAILAAGHVQKPDR